MSAASRIMRALRSLFGKPQAQRQRDPSAVATSREAHGDDEKIPGGNRAGGRDVARLGEAAGPEVAPQGDGPVAARAEAPSQSPAAAAPAKSSSTAPPPPMIPKEEPGGKREAVTAEGGILSSVAFKSIQPHVPLIRFRKGALPEGVQDVAKQVQGSLDQVAVGQSATAAATSPSSPSSSSSDAAIEFWQLPEKFRRRPIDELECDIINMGGREKPFE